MTVALPTITKNLAATASQTQAVLASYTLTFAGRGRAGVAARAAGAGAGTAGMSAGTDDTFAIPGSESQDALDHLGRVFPEVSGMSAQLVLLEPQGHRADTAQSRDASWQLPQRRAGSSRSPRWSTERASRSSFVTTS